MTDPLGAQSGATGDPQSGVPANQGTVTDPASSGQSAAGTPAPTTTDAGQSAVSREEYERIKTAMQAADKRATENENALKQLRDKDMPEMQKLQRDLTEAQAAMATMTAANEQMRVENAFLTSNEHDWHDANAALRLLDRSRVTVDADGNVQGMKDALKALAQAHPFLLKPKTAEGTPPAGTTPPPGTPPANGGIGQQQGAKPDAQALGKRFPALRQRLG